MIRPTANPLRPVTAVLTAVLLLAGCATTRSYVAPAYREQPAPPLPDGVVAYRVFLTGNTGDLATGGNEAVLTALGADARSGGEASAVVVLGNTTAAGIPDGAGEEAALQPVQALGRALRSYEGRVVVLPGHEDWRHGRAGVERLEDALLAAFGDSVLVPADQSGGPRDIELADGLRLLAIDTAWWLRDADDRPDGEFDGENVRSPADVATFLEQLVAEHDDDRLVVVGQHPIVSNGRSAGRRTVGQTVASLGVGPLVAQTVGTGPQSLASKRYRAMSDVLDRLLQRQDRLVYASALDRSLQTFNVTRSPTNRQTYLVSGTGGGRADAAARGLGAAHVLPRPGYQRLVYFADGSLWAETVEVDAATGATTVAFRTEVAGASAARVDPGIPETTTADLPAEIGTRVTVAADANFATGPFRNDGLTRFVWGGGYRDAWATPVTFDVLDLGTEAGGLVPTERGGGMQTTGLRLAGADGREYSLRLVEKGGTGQLPEELRNGAAGSVVLDLRSAQTPYAAPVAYELSRAAGVLIARPRLVYVPDDPRLGRYRSLFAGQVALLEVRAGDDMRGVEGFDDVADVVSAGGLFENLREDQDRRVDQRAFLRARLVDMLIADWDRHEDQWRWAAYEPGERDPALAGEAATRGKVYVPIARDHDFGFYGIGGVAPYFIRRFGDNRLQAFAADYGDIRALTANGFEQDRRFFNALALADMEAVARELQADLTDGVLDRAVRALPSPIYAQLGADWTQTLGVRRDKLVDLARDLYDLHAGIVDVVGSDERERFTATRERDGSLRVVVRSDKDGATDRVLYERTFLPRETDEVRFYGLGGRDRFEVVGDGPNRIAVRVVGGAARDSLDASAGETSFYDTPDGLAVGGRGRNVADRRSDDGDINRYDSYEQTIGVNNLYPVVGYNATDGVVVGASWVMQVPGFRFQPYAATHGVSASVSTLTGGVAASYVGRMREAVGTVDLDVDAFASTPRYVRNFYGLGNGTELPLTDGGERVDLARAEVDAGFGGALGQGLRLVAGPSVRYADVARGDSLVTTPVDGLPQADVYDPMLHAGAFARLSLTTAFGGANPQQGLRASVTGAVRAAATGSASTYGLVGGEAAAYVPLRFAPQLTLGLRAGADHRVGDFPFFDAAVIGGEGSLRGYRRERFAGRTAAYGGAELRTKLFSVNTYALPFTVGALAFGDAGRVWSDNVPPAFGCTPGSLCPDVDPDADSDLHLGFGGGLFFNALNRAVLTLTVGRSDESTLVTFGTGFAF